MTNLNIKVGDCLKYCDGRKFTHKYTSIHGNPKRRSGILHIPQGGGK